MLVAVTLFVPTLAAGAVQTPRPGSNLFVQTSGPNAGIGIGDFYTSPAGGDTDHLFVVRVPTDWPAGVLVTVALYDPELATPDPSSPRAADEIRGGADTTRFILRSPGGSTVADVSYSGASTNGVWVELATFDPGVTGHGSYLLRVSTSDDDDNSWRVDASYDPDCALGSPCVGVVNGNEAARAPAGSGPLAVGVVRTSWQHASLGTSCQDHVFYVNSSTARPLRAHNFDMDGSGSVTYTAPNGSTVAGTVSSNGQWNNSPNTNRVGDILPDVSGWWSARICIGNQNQYVFEAPSAGPSFPEPQPAPRLEVSKQDGVDQLTVGTQTTYTIVVDNVADEDALPGGAYEVVATDSLPAGLAFVGCSSSEFVCTEDSGTVIATLPIPLQPGDSASFDVAVTVVGDVDSPVVNLVTVDYEDSLGNGFESVHGSDSNLIDFRPALQMTLTGESQILRGDDTIVSITVSHSADSDGTAIDELFLTCGICITLDYQSGDTGDDGVMNLGETWSYTATVGSAPGDADPLHVSVRAAGLDRNDEEVAVSSSIDIDLVDAATVSGVVFEDRNGNGVRDLGEPGLDGVTVLLTDEFGTVTVVETGLGIYEFTHLWPGTYTISTDPSMTFPGINPTTGLLTSVDLAEGDDLDNIDFGAAYPVEISGNVYYNLDGMPGFGVGDSGTSGVTVELVDGAGTVLSSALSSSDGSYAFAAAPGSYRVRVAGNVPFGWTALAPTESNLGLLESGSISSGHNFGLSNSAPLLVTQRQTVIIGGLLQPMQAVDSDSGVAIYRLISGILPPGVSLNPDGTFGGIPLSNGIFELQIEVCDDADPSLCATYPYELEVLAVQVVAVDSLPFTGGELGELGISGALLALGGSLVLVAANRRRDQIVGRGDLA